MTNTNFSKGVRFFYQGRGERYCAMAISRYIVSYNMEIDETFRVGVSFGIKITSEAFLLDA